MACWSSQFSSTRVIYETQSSFDPWTRWYQTATILPYPQHLYGLELSGLIFLILVDYLRTYLGDVCVCEERQASDLQQAQKATVQNKWCLLSFSWFSPSLQASAVPTFCGCKFMCKFCRLIWLPLPNWYIWKQIKSWNCSQFNLFDLSSCGVIPCDICGSDVRSWSKRILLKNSDLCTCINKNFGVLIRWIAQQRTLNTGKPIVSSFLRQLWMSLNTNTKLSISDAKNLPVARRVPSEDDGEYERDGRGAGLPYPPPEYQPPLFHQGLW